MSLMFSNAPLYDYSEVLQEVQTARRTMHSRRSIKAPSTIDAEHWPPDYLLVRAWRQKQLALLEGNKKLVRGAKRFYASNLDKFILHWVDTYDPRNVARGLPPVMPLILFPRQVALVQFILSCIKAEQNGLIEKSRDMGATWVACALSVGMWLFWPGTAIGWGSRKQELVDRLGDPNSIFEKIRIIVSRIPELFLPESFVPGDHSNFMRLLNPGNGSTVVGETGDNIGRGGRTLVYFKDESAHYARPELIEAALMDNTRCQIDISSVNGVGTVFQRKRDNGVEWEPGDPIAKGKTNVFVLDWQDHPAKTQAWYDERRGRAEAEGLLHLFAQEVDRDPAAAVEGIIIRQEWIRAAIDADKKLGIEVSGPVTAALDVADGGRDTNAQCVRRGIKALFLDEWTERDTAFTARRSIKNLEPYVDEGIINFQYDALGVGAGVKAETNRLKDDNLLPAAIKITPWMGSDTVLDPYGYVVPGDKKSARNRDFFQNLKAQAWWQVARAFARTYRAVNDPTYKWKPDELIVIPSNLKHLTKLMKELSQPTTAQSSVMKLLVNKTPEGTKSPNLGDAFVMCYWPIRRVRIQALARGLTPLGGRAAKAPRRDQHGEDRR